MRVSTGMIQQVALNQLNEVWSRLQTLQTHISTGQQIIDPSDDPIATGHILRARSNIRANAQYQRGLNEARQFATASEAALMRMMEVGEQMLVAATKVFDDSNGIEVRQSLAMEVDGLLNEMISLANSQYDTQRLFGGYRTQAEPFSAITDTSGRVVEVRSSGPGGEGRPRRLVGENLLLTINLTGTDLFGEDYQLFTDMVALRDAALTGDAAAGSDLTARLEADFDQLNLALATTGGLVARMDSIEGWLTAQEVELQASRSQYEDLDMAATAMELQKEQAILEAAMTVTVQLLDLSLVTFMR